MQLFIAALVIVALAVLLLCFNIIFRKGKTFPDGEISRNKELRKKGIICANEEEMKIWGKRTPKGTPSCGNPDCQECPAKCK